MPRNLNTATQGHVAPLLLFMVVSCVIPWVQIENPLHPWWRFAPEHWVYPLQCLVATIVLWKYWPHYQFRPIKGLGLATCYGLIGITWWLLPAWSYNALISAGIEVPEWASWFGFEAREKGFDPDLFSDTPWAYITTLTLRFLRMVVVVALVEEIFWRGFLARYLQAEGDDFRRIPFGQHHWKSFGIVTACFMLAHQPVDWLGALGFGALMHLLSVQTRSLAACVVMHAVANLALGIYVVLTKQWGYW